MKLKKLNKYLVLYKCLFVQDLKSKMSYPVDFLVAMFAMLCTNLLGFLSFWVIFDNFSSIGGFSYYEITFIYGFYLTAITPGQIFFSNNWNLATKVYTGDFLIYCIKPINTFFYFYSESRDYNAAIQGLVGLLTVFMSWNKLGYVWNIRKILLLIIGMTSASLVFIAIMNLVASIAFFAINGDFLLEIINKVKECAKYPLSIYNKIFTIVFSVIIPLGYLSFYPSVLVLRDNWNQFFLIISPFVGFVMFVISYKIWLFMAGRYVGTGS